jgi:hypothetical protein
LLQWYFSLSDNKVIRREHIHPFAEIDLITRNKMPENPKVVEPELKKMSSSKNILVVGACVAIISVLIVASAILYTAQLKPPPPPEPLPLRIVSVNMTPDPPIPEKNMTVTILVEGGTGHVSVNLGYRFYFAEGIGGGSRTVPYIGNGAYQTELGSSRTGSEVWIVASASTAVEGPVLYNCTFQVGDVLRNGSSGLKISDVIRNPFNPTHKDNITITANVTSGAKIREVLFAYEYAARFGCGGGAGSMSMDGSGSYHAIIQQHHDDGFPIGAIFLYRVVAIDESNNTAVSSTYSYIISK